VPAIHVIAFRLLLAALLVFIAACSGIAFREDKRVTISSPKDRATVTLPTRVQWTVSDFDAVGLDGSNDPKRGVFAVFVDRAPMSPGKDLRSLAEGDTHCRTPECPDDAWFRQHFVFIAKDTLLALNALPDLRDRPVGPDKHELTVVLVNGRGSRIGESAFAIEFYVNRRGDGG
jgi:hypothetical protein